MPWGIKVIVLSGLMIFMITEKAILFLIKLLTILIFYGIIGTMKLGGIYG